MQEGGLGEIMFFSHVTHYVFFYCFLYTFLNCDVTDHVINEHRFVKYRSLRKSYEILKIPRYLQFFSLPFWHPLPKPKRIRKICLCNLFECSCMHSEYITASLNWRALCINMLTRYILSGQCTIVTILNARGSNLQYSRVSGLKSSYTYKVLLSCKMSW